MARRTIDNLPAAPESNGVVRRIHEAGLCYIVEEGTNQSFAFTFDKIAHYRGESASEIGLEIGSRVRFRTDGEQVLTVEVPKAKARSI